GWAGGPARRRARPRPPRDGGAPALGVAPAAGHGPAGRAPARPGSPLIPARRQATVAPSEPPSPQETAMHPRATPLLLAALALAGPASAADLPKVAKVERQPLAAQAKRVAEALERLGAPLPAADLKALAEAADDKNKARAVAAIQTTLDKHCLVGVPLDAPAKGKKGPAIRVVRGLAKAELAEQGWRVFLVKVYNPSSMEEVELRAASPNALPPTRRSSGKPDPNGF